jgi:hypothetical protein
MVGGISSDQNSFHRTGKDLYRKTRPNRTGVNEMNADQILNEIREANLSYLMLAQSLIRSDREQALYRLGISEESAALIGLLTPAQMMKIAASNTLVSNSNRVPRSSPYVRAIRCAMLSDGIPLASASCVSASATSPLSAPHGVFRYS